MKNKYALVTGASNGIGKATAIELAQQGYTVFINYYSDRAGALDTRRKVKAAGSKGYLVQGDVSKERQMIKMFGQIAKVSKRLDVVVNNAGIDNDILIEDYPLREMKRVINVNLVGPIIVTKLALPFLKKSKNPQIINIASRMGNEKIIEGVGPYASSKAGLIRFTKCCALEFRKYRIRANSVCPGFTDTKINRDIYPDEKFWDKMAETNPCGRVGQPKDIANVVGLLVSDKASYINGQEIGVTGGSSLV